MLKKIDIPTAQTTPDASFGPFSSSSPPALTLLFFWLLTVAAVEAWGGSVTSVDVG
jgi:hypothetical protein